MHAGNSPTPGAAVRIPLALLLSCVGAWAQTYTEFYCQTTANNLNAGSTTDDSANSSYAGGTWVAATGVFTAVSGNPTTDTGVTNGAWASVYTTAGATVATCVGRITNTSATTITLDLATISGAASNPSASGGATTCKVGGAWKGPNSTVGHPFGFIATNSVSSANQFPRVNFKSGVTYSVTAAMAHSLNGPTIFQGYTTTPGDMGKATIDGGTSGASYILLALSGASVVLADMILDHNGATGGANLLNVNTSPRALVLRCVLADGRGAINLGSQTMISCEVYGNNGNAAAIGAVSIGAGGTMLNCYVHDNTSAKTSGAQTSGSGWTVFANCIFANNATNGIFAVSSVIVLNCDFYSNPGSGIEITLATPLQAYIQNCNFLKNGFGVSNSAPARIGAIYNCGFGAGSMANSANEVNMGAMIDSGGFSYASGVTPWVNPDTGNYSITLRSAKSAGLSKFVETFSNFGGTVGYPDVGAAQSPSTNTPGSWTFSQ